MPQCHIGVTKLCQPVPVKGNMLCVPAVSQQDFHRLPLLGPGFVIKTFRYLPFSITHPVHAGSQLRKLYMFQLFSQQRKDPGLPPVGPVIGSRFQIVVISGHKYYPGMLQAGEQIIQFFQFPQKGLTVEQVTGYQKKVRLLPLADLYDSFQAVP